MRDHYARADTIEHGTEGGDGRRIVGDPARHGPHGKHVQTVHRKALPVEGPALSEVPGRADTKQAPGLLRRAHERRAGPAALEGRLAGAPPPRPEEQPSELQP